MILGIAAKDWIQTRNRAPCACSGSSPPRTISAPTTKAAECAAAAEGARSGPRSSTLLAAVGNFAETLSTPGKDSAAARNKILEDLVDRMVNRTHRDRGAVVSLGGDLALLGGTRTDFSTGAQVAFPLQLGLGLGVQTYGPKDAGFDGVLPRPRAVRDDRGRGLTVATPRSSPA